MKLDGSFANETEKNEEKREELMEMVRSLQASGVLATISGVDDSSTLPTLFMAGINYIQGTYIPSHLMTWTTIFLRKVSRKSGRPALNVTQFLVSDSHQIKKTIEA